MQKIILLALIILLVILYKQNTDMGFKLKYNQIRQMTMQLHQSNLAIQQRNGSLNQAIIGLKTSPLSIEMQARYQLNLIAKNEKLILIPAKYYK